MEMSLRDWRAVALYLAALSSAMAVFAAWPGIDLAVSGVFAREGAGFPLARSGLAALGRSGVWVLSYTVVIVALAMALARPFVKRVDMVRRDWRLWLWPARIWGFVLGVYLVGPWLITDVILKAHWGRARPRDVVEFGGALDFTPAFQVSDACAANCSFVSGEGAGATALGLALWVIGRHALGPGRGVAAVALGVALVGSVLRVMTGGHFLSDIVFAAFEVVGVAWPLARLTGVAPLTGPWRGSGPARG